jgi:hypothetical protein
MGIGIVLLFWAVVGTVLAGFGALVLGGVASFFIGGAQEGRRKVIVAACAFPFVCLGWAGLLFIFQASVNGFLLHRDPGLGDSWECPLPNGYAITMIDVTDQGSVYNPKTQSGGGIGEREDSVSGVCIMQLAGRYIFGGFESHQADVCKRTDVDSYFLLDTETGKRTQYTKYEDLNHAASQLGFALKLEDIDTVYSRYRFTWFDVLVAVLLVLPPLVYGWWLVRGVLTLRKTRYPSRAPA